MVEVSGWWVLGRPRLGWVNGVKWSRATRMTLEAARKIGRAESTGTYHM